MLDVDLLIVEDNTPLRVLLAQALEDEGFVVHQACSSNEALRLIRSRLCPAVLIADVYLGTQNKGFDLVLKCADACPYAKIILIFGVDISVPINVAGRSIDVLFKPFSICDLTALVKNYVPKESRSYGRQPDGQRNLMDHTSLV